MRAVEYGKSKWVVLYWSCRTKRLVLGTSSWRHTPLRCHLYIFKVPGSSTNVGLVPAVEDKGFFTQLPVTCVSMHGQKTLGMHMLGQG